VSFFTRYLSPEFRFFAKIAGRANSDNYSVFANLTADSLYPAKSTRTKGRPESDGLPRLTPGENYFI
jgi:hypothetical protein